MEQYIGNFNTFNNILLKTSIKLCQNEKIAKYLINQNTDPLKTELISNNLVDDLLWKKIYPYSFIPEIVQEESCIIMVDLSEFELSKTNKAIKTGYLTIDILCHRNLMRTIYGTRTGEIISAIDGELNGTRVGLSKLQFYQGMAWNRQPKQYIGYKLVYRLFDLNG